MQKVKETKENSLATTDALDFGKIIIIIVDKLEQHVLTIAAAAADATAANGRR